MRRATYISLVVLVSLSLWACGGGTEEDPSVKAAHECLSYEAGESKQEGIDECLAQLGNASK